MKLIIILTLIPAFLVAATAPQIEQGYNIEIEVDGIGDSTLMLAYHFGDRKLIKDTITLDREGRGVFSGTEPLPGGIYLVVLPEMSYFEIIIDREQSFSLKTDFKDPWLNLSIEGSNENEQFLAYHRFMNKQQSAAADVQSRINDNRGNPDSLSLLYELGRELDREVRDYWQSIIENEPGTLLANMVKAMRNPDIPHFDLPENAENPDSLRWVMGYEYSKQHFFDNIDFSDERLLRTPVLHNRLEHFFSRLLIPDPGVIFPQVKRVVELSRSNDQVFQYVLTYLLNKYERSQIMGHDKVFVKIADEYYLSGEAHWITNETARRLSERVERIRPNLIGVIAAEMEMASPEGEKISLHNIEAELTVVYFFEPECIHCKEVTPRLSRLYEEFNSRGLEVFGVYIYDDIEEWNQYIAENSLDWINVYDPLNETNFRHNYDIYSTPTLYILDREKEIVAKRIGIETAEDIIRELLD